MKKFLTYVKALGQEFSNDNVPLLAAAQAYYYMLSLVPMLVLAISILPYLNIDPDAAMSTIQGLMPGGVSEVFEDQIADILTEQRGGLLTVGIIGTLWSASNGMNTFIKAQNEAYNVKQERSFIMARLVSIALTLGLILALIVALILPVFGNTIINSIAALGIIPGELEFLFNVLRWVISITVTAVIFAVLYHVAPNIKIPFKNALPGAIFATFAWQLVSFGFSIYINNFNNYAETYGSLGGIFILMLWLFIIGIILVVGAEINAILYRRRQGKALVEE
ncbi:YihY/virulence factor BrkB family protein [Alkalicoccus saliphilus]|jgi:membrane protein|uniref:Ribonuclease n=1 Tax=Alkalicoccus saliphilus TaxID=200989 RepID=A0A2T4U995_9BACI|nr:YihY/virulence factor BrkB family protein [Alkalicoccus saliphilus]PTL39971.1 ribonuclease [Alkalicoccus saliphilus]